jgi:hypothetical protein
MAFAPCPNAEVANGGEVANPVNATRGRKNPLSAANMDLAADLRHPKRSAPTARHFDSQSWTLVL